MYMMARSEPAYDRHMASTLELLLGSAFDDSQKAGLCIRCSIPYNSGMV